VVKANGLAGGKGVIIAENADEAEKAVVNILQVWDKFERILRFLLLKLQEAL
jgi:phosphoribosylamine-glycine ligase